MRIDMDTKVTIGIDPKAGQLWIEDGTLFIGERTPIVISGHAATTGSTTRITLLDDDGKTPLADNSANAGVLDMRGAALRSKMVVEGQALPLEAYAVDIGADGNDVVAKGRVAVKWAPFVANTDGTLATLTGPKGDKGDVGHVGPMGPLTQAKDPQSGRWYNVYARVDDSGNRVLSLEQEDSDPKNGGDVAMRSELAAEKTERLAGIAAEASARSAAVSAEATAREAAVSAEATAREGAITTAIAEEVTARDAAIAIETSARQAAVTAETTARQAAVAEEASTRASADTALSARTDGLQARISTLEGIAAVGTLCGMSLVTLTTTSQTIDVSPCGLGYSAGKTYKALMVYAVANVAGKLYDGETEAETPQLASNVHCYVKSVVATEQSKVLVTLKSSNVSYLKTVLILVFKDKETA